MQNRRNARVLAMYISVAFRYQNHDEINIFASYDISI